MILLDLNLPDMNGHSVLRNLRLSRIETPVLVLSGLDDTANKLEAFKLGADDYLIKPYNTSELIARIRAIVRRSKPRSQSVVQVGDMTLDLEANTVRVRGATIHLTGKEFQILELMCLRKGKLLTKETFLDQLYRGMDEPDPKIIDVFICNLRKKLSAASVTHAAIRTVWGRGYVLDEISQLAA